MSHDDHVTAQPVAEVTPVTYDSGAGYQQESTGVMLTREGEKELASGYIPQPSLPATQEPLAPPSPAAQPPVME